MSGHNLAKVMKEQLADEPEYQQLKASLREMLLKALMGTPLDIPSSPASHPHTNLMDELVHGYLLQRGCPHTANTLVMECGMDVGMDRQPHNQAVEKMRQDLEAVLPSSHVPQLVLLLEYFLQAEAERSGPST